MVNLPTGTTIFPFADIEGSTTYWEQHPEITQNAVARHDALLNTVMEGHLGSVFKTVGDAFYVVFSSARDAFFTSIAAQQALQAEGWSEEISAFRVRIALHMGEAELRGNDYSHQRRWCGI